MIKKKSLMIGSKKTVTRAISKRLDRQIKIKMTELKKKNPKLKKKITYIYVSNNLDLRWRK